MFERKPKAPEGPTLLDRIEESGCRRVAILGLHPRAGARTVLAALVAQLRRAGEPMAATSVPRLPPEAEIITADPVTRIALPAGAHVATAEGASVAARPALELVEATRWGSSLGPIGIYRLSADAEVDLYGPEESDALIEVLGRLAELSGGRVLVDGGWERRAFAAPGVTDGAVLVLASGYSATPERSAAAARYHVETLAVRACAPQLAAAWHEASTRGIVALADAAGDSLGFLPPGLDDPVPFLRGIEGRGVDSILLPHGLHDEFMIPLVRSTFRCRLVVRDATRIGLAPIYFKAWTKGDGSIEAVRPTRILALATNPVNPAGPDADPVQFRELVAAANPRIPAHDVFLESEEGQRRPAWKFWA